MAGIRFELPRVVTLPATPTIEHNHLRIALADPSKQLLSLWRRRGFAKSYRDGNTTFCMTDDVEIWLLANGVQQVRRGNHDR